MKNHIITLILLLLAVFAFVLRFFLEEKYILYCDVAAFALPTLAAIVEIVVSEKGNKELESEIQKRAIWEHLSKEEYDRRNAEGTLDENTYYATTEK